MTVTGQMNLESDLVALVAEGDVVVQGRGQDDGTRVQGLVYTKGSFKAQDSTIVGAVVSARVDGTTELDRVNMIQVPGVTDFEVVVDKAMEEVVSEAHGDDYLIGIDYQGSFITFDKMNRSALRDLASALVTVPEEQRGTIRAFKKNGDGSRGEEIADPRETPAFRDFDHKGRAWSDYLIKLTSGTLERTEIFKLDLNSFLSIGGSLEVLFWKSFRQSTKEQDLSDFQG